MILSLNFIFRHVLDLLELLTIKLLHWLVHVDLCVLFYVTCGVHDAAGTKRLERTGFCHIRNGWSYFVLDLFQSDQENE